MNDKIWGTSKTSHHGVSFSESVSENPSPHKHYPIHHSSKEAGITKPQANELTLDDLTGKSKDDGKSSTHKPEPSINFSNSHAATRGNEYKSRFAGSNTREYPESKELAYSPSSYKGSPTFNNSARMNIGTNPEAQDSIDKIYNLQSPGQSVNSRPFSLLDKHPGRNYELDAKSSGANISFSRNSGMNASPAKETSNKYQNFQYAFEQSGSTRLSSNYDFNNLSNNKNRLQSSNISLLEKRSRTSSVDPISKLSKHSPGKPWHDDYIKGSRSSDINVASLLASVHLRNSGNNNSESKENDLKQKLQAFSHRLAEIQEEFAQSKVSNNDPYKISLHSVAPITREEGLESASSKQFNSGQRLFNVFEQTNRFEKSQPLSSLDPAELYNQSKGTTESLTTPKPGMRSTVPKDYREQFNDIKLRYYNTFLPDDAKILNNSYKIWKYRMDTKLEKSVQGCMDEFVQLQNEINYNLFEPKF